MKNIKQLKARVRVLTKRDRIAQARQLPLEAQLHISTMLCEATDDLRERSLEDSFIGAAHHA